MVPAYGANPICLVDLVCFVYLVDLVHLVSFVQPKNQTNQIDQTNYFFSILLRRSIRLFGCHAIRSKRGGINLL